MADKLFMLFDEYADKFEQIPSLPLLYFGHFMIVTLKLRGKIGKKYVKIMLIKLLYSQINYLMKAV